MCSCNYSHIHACTQLCSHTCWSAHCPLVLLRFTPSYMLRNALTHAFTCSSTHTNKSTPLLQSHSDIHVYPQGSHSHAYARVCVHVCFCGHVCVHVISCVYIICTVRSHACTCSQALTQAPRGADHKLLPHEGSSHFPQRPPPCAVE